MISFDENDRMDMKYSDLLLVVSNEINSLLISGDSDDISIVNYETVVQSILLREEETREQILSKA